MVREDKAMTKDEAIAKAVEDGDKAYSGTINQLLMSEETDPNMTMREVRLIAMEAGFRAALRAIEPEWGLVRLLPDDPQSDVSVTWATVIGVGGDNADT